MLSEKNIRDIEDIILDPTIAILHHDARPFTLSPKAMGGTLQPGDRLMTPTGSTRHRSTFSILEKGRDDGSPGREKYRVEHEHTGYWSRISTTTLFLPIEFRGMTPVWMFALSGTFLGSTNSAHDQDIAERIDKHLLEGYRAVFQLRRKGDRNHYLRSPEYERNGLLYKSHWNGNFSDFFGSEEVILDGLVTVWKAHFFGRIIVPVS